MEAHISHSLVAVDDGDEIVQTKITLVIIQLRLKTCVQLNTVYSFLMELNAYS
jgi:hypothetical protein